MESIRQAALQAELKRIEATAEANSYAIMNKADQPAQAHMLCNAINEGIILVFQPSVIYDLKPGCEIVIYTHDSSSHFMRRAKNLGLTVSSAEELFKGTHGVSFVEFPGVTVYLKSEAVIYADDLVEQAA